jgi:predicted nucleotidyltransferase
MLAAITKAGRFERMRAMNLLESIARGAVKRNLKSVVIGGMAVIEYGYARSTTDFDLLVQNSDKETWDELLTSIGYRLDHDGGSFRQYLLREGTGWPIDLMLVNEQTFQGIASATKSAAIEGVQMQVVSLEHLLALILHALKHTRIQRFFKDFDDVIRLVSINKIDLHSQPIRDLFMKYGNEDLYGKVCRACEA